jgi:hypothetical protein
MKSLLTRSTTFSIKPLALVGLLMISIGLLQSCAPSNPTRGKEDARAQQDTSGSPEQTNESEPTQELCANELNEISQRLPKQIRDLSQNEKALIDGTSQPIAQGLLWYGELTKGLNDQQKLCLRQSGFLLNLMTEKLKNN